MWPTVPTPGVPGSQGGLNGVFGLVRGQRIALSMGEPEPNDIVMAPNGNLYWTCTTAGVILCQTPAGETSLLLGGLDQPVGITADLPGNLYFTELPTPGVETRDTLVLYAFPERGDFKTFGPPPGNPGPRRINEYFNGLPEKLSSIPTRRWKRVENTVLITP